MNFTFFDASDHVLFSREDAESASWTQEEMSLQALFPYDAAKVIQRGQRIGFTDDTGVFQVFEIRKVRDYEPDHYQEVTAEHIAIAELTDEFFNQEDFDEMTAGDVLAELLTGTLWQVGTDTTQNTSTAHIGMGHVWADVRTVEENWNVYITPRVTVNSTGITGRYLDIQPAQGVWRGIRLSLDKNADEMGVTWDDSRVKTALYGFGASVDVEGQEEQAPLTFADEVWTATADHPAKPADQTYIEDPAATAAYGRNGRPRFGFYQNGDIDDPALLLQKTWEALKSVSSPDVTVDCMVRDLHRLGYADQPLRLHDTALVEIRPTGVVLALEIIKLTVDLLDPTATRPTIGTYIPNIVYIAKETSDRATGGGGGSGGQTNAEYEISEFETEIALNKYEISLRAYQIDLDNVDEILRQAGISLNAQGVITYADDNVNMWQSKLNVQADRISLVVTGSGANAQVNPASIVAAVNAQTGSFVQISADKINLSGYVTVTDLEAGTIEAIDIGSGTLSAGIGSFMSITVDGGITCGDLLYDDGEGSVSASFAELEDAVTAFGSYTASGGQITIPYTQWGGGTGSIAFDAGIAAVQIAGPTGNTYKLQYKLCGDSAWTDAGTFSRATALTGAWSSGVYTVTASPQGNAISTELDEIALNGTPTVSGSSFVVPCKVTELGGAAVLTDNVGFSFADFLQSKSVSPATYARTITPDSAYIGLSSVSVSAVSYDTPSITCTNWQSGSPAADRTITVSAGSRGFVVLTATANGKQAQYTIVIQA